MKTEGRDPVLKKSRWLLLKRSENLDADQHFRLRDILRYNLKTVRALPPLKKIARSLRQGYGIDGCDTCCSR